MLNPAGFLCGIHKVMGLSWRSQTCQVQRHSNTRPDTGRPSPEVQEVSRQLDQSKRRREGFT